MDIKLDAAYIQANHKNCLDMFVKDLRASDSQSRNNHKSKFVYTLTWCEKHVGDSYHDIMTGKTRQRQIEQEKRTTKQRIDDRMARSFVSLCISTGRFKRFYYPILPLPALVKDAIIEQENKKERERTKKVKALPRDALMELFKDSGFFAVSIGG